MYCYFDGASSTPENGQWKGNWLAWNIHSPPAYNFELYGYHTRPECRAPGTGELVTQLYEGKEVSTHLDCPDYQIDDLYFYSMGIMKNMIDGSALEARNWTAWMETIDRKCQELRDEYHFTDEEITVAHLTIQNGPGMCKPTWDSWRGGPPTPA